MNTKPSSAKPLRAEILPLLMAIIAVVSVEVAQDNGDQPRWHVALKSVLLTVPMCGFYRACSRQGTEGLSFRGWMSPLLICLALLPLPIEYLQNLIWHTGSPLEILLLAAFRNLTCGLAILSYLPACDRICCVISLFLVVFSSCIKSEPLVIWLVALYALCGVWWLMGVYWDSVQGFLTGSTSQREFPKRLLVAILLTFLVLVGLMPLAAPRIASALPGFMPTSGGDKWSDPNARSGVNDGEALVPATDQARSFGPVETDVFMESDQPSLYDIFNDTYGEPPKPKRLKQDRAIGLPPGLLTHTHDRIAQQKKLGQQFSTQRSTRSKTHKQLHDIEGKALFYVGGRTPLHLRLMTYDIFDGLEWFPDADASVHRNGLRLETVGSQPWIRVDGHESEKIYRHRESHQLKIIGLKTNRIPAPPGLMGVHIDRVDRVDLFGWAQGSIIKMERDQLPELTVIHLQSRVADIAALLREPFRTPSTGIQFQQLPDQFPAEKIRTLAHSWVDQIPDGWPRIEAVLARLRAEYQLDRDYRPPTDCQDTVGEFLFESRRGPDYVFASASATMLRSLGYSTRVVSGFYASPLKFDRKSRHTPVAEADIHFWAEVYVGNSTWVTLEPTPGYEVLLPPPGYWGSCLQVISAFAQHVAQHPWFYSLILLFAGVVAWFRVELCDWVITAEWTCFPRSQPRGHVLGTVALLKRRASLVGLPHPAGQTTSRWLRELSHSDATVDRGLTRSFSQAVDWAAYAPPQIASPPIDDLGDLCRSVARQWTLTRLRQTKTGDSQHAAVSH